MEDPTNPRQAQERIRRIHAFREELGSLELHKVLTLSPQAKNALSHYHSRLIADLNRRFDTDATLTGEKLTLGMRILTFLGGCALSASVFFFFYQIWGNLTTPAQVVLLISAPVLALVLMEVSARLEKSLYFATLCALLAFFCFVLNLRMLGQIFNIIPSPNAFLAWGLFGLALAYHRGIKIILLLGLVCLMVFTTATVGTFHHYEWSAFWQRPESFFLSGLGFLAVPALVRHKEYIEFPWVYQLLGLMAVFLPLWYLGHCGWCSFLPLGWDSIEVLYQVLGFALAGGAIGLGIRNRNNGLANFGCIFFTVFLYTKFFDWWWDLIPKYLFFLIIGLISIGLLVAFKKMRNKYLEEV